MNKYLAGRLIRLEAQREQGPDGIKAAENRRLWSLIMKDPPAWELANDCERIIALASARNPELRSYRHDHPHLLQRLDDATLRELHDKTALLEARLAVIGAVPTAPNVTANAAGPARRSVSC